MIGLDGKTLEASLVQRPGAGGTVGSVPTLRVGDGQQAEELAQLAILPRPEDLMPMIRHEAVRQQPRGETRVDISERALEGGVVAVVLEERHAPDRTIEHVVDDAASGGTRAAWHAKRISRS